MPGVSVLLPSYNHGRFLTSTLQSLFDQTFADWELIVIDDGSSDDSVKMLEDLSDPRVKFSINEKNLGTYGTLCKACSQAKGDFIAVLNSDDAWGPDKLELQFETFQRNPNIALCYTAGQTFGSSGEINPHSGWPTDDVQELLPYLLEENRVLASSVMFRRENAAFDPSLRYSGDWEALLRPARTGPFGFVVQELTRWRIHDNNTFVRSEGQVAEEIRLRRSILYAKDSWFVRGLSSRAISQGLSRCAIHLSALLVLQGRGSEARAAARLALKLERSPQALKRLAIVSLPTSMALARLWPGEAIRSSNAEEGLIRF